MQDNLYVAIMAGGIGSRFWPKSRSAYPKQFLDILATGQTLLQATFERFSRFVPVANIYVVTSEDYTTIVGDQLPLIAPENILSEPCRKNTAPCIAYISFKLREKNPNACLIVAPSDHLIKDPITFQSVCSQAAEFVKHEKAFVTLGIRPSYPNTGYGYIRYNPEPTLDNLYKVEQFTEKPDLPTAMRFIENGNYLWNAGIFIWKTHDIIEAFGQYLPDMYTLFEGADAHWNTDREREAISRIYPRCENISIDFGIMEKAREVYVIPSDFKWSDLGTWNSAYDNLPKDSAENALAGENIITVKTKGCMIHAAGKKLVLAQGLEDLIVVDTDDILMICKKDSEQEIKQYVADIKRTKGDRFV